MTPPPTPPGRRLVHRVPVRVRHYWRLLVTCAAFVVVCAVVFSTVRVTPLVTSSSDSSADKVTQDITGTTDLFDSTVAHRITVTFRDADYQPIQIVALLKQLDHCTPELLALKLVPPAASY